MAEKVSAKLKEETELIKDDKASVLIDEKKRRAKQLEETVR